MTQCAVYAIASAIGPVKIGMTKTPQRRLSTLKVGLPFNVRIAHLRWLPDAETAQLVEQGAHTSLKSKRLNGEWFSCSEEEAITAIEAVDSNKAPQITVSRKHPGRIVIIFGDSISAPINIEVISKIDIWRMAAEPVLSRSEAAIQFLNKGLDLAAAPVRKFDRGNESSPLEARLNDYRAASDEPKRDIPSRAEAIRRLVEKGLAS